MFKQTRSSRLPFKGKFFEERFKQPNALKVFKFWYINHSFKSYLKPSAP